MAVTNQDIAELFENMAVLLEAKGDTVFKIRAYRRATRTIEQLPFSLEQALKEGRDLKSIPGFGDAISGKVRELVETGRVRAYDSLLGELPDGVLTLMNVPGIGPKTAMRITGELGTTTVEAVEEAGLDGRLVALPGLGAKSAENILKHVRSLRTKDQRIPIGRASAVADEIYCGPP